jgi:hypothetical protein
MKPLAFLLALTAAMLVATPALGEPSPGYSSVPAWLNVVTPQPWGLEPEDFYTVVVRDEFGAPMPGVQVVLDFGGCTSIRFAAEQKIPADVVVDCGADTMRAITDASGTATFVVYGSVVDRSSPDSEAGCLAVYADYPRVLIGSSSVRSYDLDGVNGLTANDLSLWLCDSFSGQYFARSDYNGSGGINALDLNLWMTKYFKARGNGRTAARCDVFPSTTPYVRAADGLPRLAWSACRGDGGDVTATFACNTNAGAEYLVGSFIAPADIPSLTGFDAEVWIVGDAGDPIANWWRLESGGCHAPSSGLVDPTYEVCLPPGGGAASWSFISAAEYSGTSSPFRNVVVVRVSGAVAQPVGVDAGTEYELFTLKIPHTKTTGAGSCAGCAEPAVLMLDWVYLRQSGVAGTGCSLPYPGTPPPDYLLRQGDESIAWWQGVPSGSIPIGVGDPPAPKPGVRLAVDNPARGAASVTFELPRPLRCTLALYDVAGRVRATLFRGEALAGAHTLRWSGSDDAGATLPSGYYVLRLVTEDGAANHPLVWLR